MGDGRLVQKCRRRPVQSTEGMSREKEKKHPKKILNNCGKTGVKHDILFTDDDTACTVAVQYTLVGGGEGGQAQDMRRKTKPLFFVVQKNGSKN